MLRGRGREGGMRERRAVLFEVDTAAHDLPEEVRGDIRNDAYEGQEEHSQPP